ncbi:MAG: hypothetical protein ISP92_10645, partial [Pseudomonadales bacterium]|nr:hypothetical protein [Pseudomonadales bacterium]
MMGFKLVTMLLVMLVAGCAAKQPENIDNICDIYGEQRSWYKASQKAAKRWGTTAPVIMAIIHQESSFKA